MTRFISISGPSSTGKSTLVRELRAQFPSSSVKTCSDFHEVTWKEFLNTGKFKEFTEIQNDSEYLCIYILRLIKDYESLLSTLKDSKYDLVILDGCWLDLFVYTNLQMWYSSFVREVQEDILMRICRQSSDIDKIYITKADDEKYPTLVHDRRSHMVNFHRNRKLELQYYELAKRFKGTVELPDPDIKEAVNFIMTDIESYTYPSEI